MSHGDIVNLVSQFWYTCEWVCEWEVLKYNCFCFRLDESCKKLYKDGKRYTEANNSKYIHIVHDSVGDCERVPCVCSQLETLYILSAKRPYKLMNFYKFLF